MRQKHIKREEKFLAALADYEDQESSQKTDKPIPEQKIVRDIAPSPPPEQPVWKPPVPQQSIVGVDPAPKSHQQRRLDRLKRINTKPD